MDGLISQISSRYNVEYKEGSLLFHIICDRPKGIEESVCIRCADMNCRLYLWGCEGSEWKQRVFTPLMLAVQLKKVNAVRALCALDGIDLFMKNDQGKTVFDMWRHYGREIRDILRDARLVREESAVEGMMLLMAI